MKTLFASLLLTFVALTPNLAQTTVDAREIIAKINHKEPVSYQNTTIIGDLDLTNLANRREISEGNWRGEPREYRSTVEVPLTFRNCTFRGKVLAYWSEESKPMKTGNKVYNADFDEAVTIENCTFVSGAAFKYSRFQQRAVFTDTQFSGEALFKYALFSRVADFSGSTFRSYADFKYTKFDESSYFRNAAFGRYADFKYTKFDERVDFSHARFSGSADFKYTKFPPGSNFDNTRFDGSTDFKYTMLAGRRFAPGDR